MGAVENNANKCYCKLLNEVQVYNCAPRGWKRIHGALTAPYGYVWIYNSKSVFSEEYKHALLKL